MPQLPMTPQQSAAHRRLLITILGLDVASLGTELEAKRLLAADLRAILHPCFDSRSREMPQETAA